MKRSLFLFFFALGLSLLPSLRASAQTQTPEQRAQQRDASASALVRLISDALSKSKIANWEVYYQPQHDLILVKRKQAVLMTPTSFFKSSGPLEENSTIQLSHPTFSFRVQPFISLDKYMQLKAENAGIWQRLRQMATEMRGINQKFGIYRPGNTEEARKVDTYDQLKRSIRELPDFCFQDISLSWGLLNTAWGIYAFHEPGETPPFLKEADKRDGWEYEQVQATQAILSLLSRYKSDPE